MTTERLARALHAVDVEATSGDGWANPRKPASDEWDFGPAEYMRHLYRERARAILAATRRSPVDWVRNRLVRTRDRPPNTPGMVTMPTEPAEPIDVERMGGGL